MQDKRRHEDSKRNQIDNSDPQLHRELNFLGETLAKQADMLARIYPPIDSHQTVTGSLKIQELVTPGSSNRKSWSIRVGQAVTAIATVAALFFATLPWLGKSPTPIVDSQQVPDETGLAELNDEHEQQHVGELIALTEETMPASEGEALVPSSPFVASPVASGVPTVAVEPSSEAASGEDPIVLAPSTNGRFQVDARVRSRIAARRQVKSKSSRGLRDNPAILTEFSALEQETLLDDWSGRAEKLRIDF